VKLRDGRLCGCGQHGCLEAYASGNNIAKRAHEELANGKVSSAVQAAGGIEKVHAGFLDEAARDGDAYATQLWHEVSDYAALSIGAAITVLNPSRLVMGGGVWTGAPRLAHLIREKLMVAINGPSLEGFEILDTALGDDAGRLGAAAAIVEGGVHHRLR